MTPTEGTDAGLETVDSSVDTEVIEGGDQSGVETPEVVETTDPKLGDQQQPYRAVSEDGKRLDEKARATLDELKAKDPALAKAFREALFKSDAFEKLGGLKEVQQLRQTIEQLGGPQGIENIQAEVKGWNDFDQQYMAGDPKALEFMLSSPESQQAFMKLAPMAFNKFEELNPEGYASYLCQRIVGDAVANRVPISMELAQHYLAAGDATKAAEEFAKVVNWFQGLDATAKKPIAPKEPAADPNNPRLRELEQQNEGFVRDQWRQETAKEQNTVYASELNRLLAGRKVTDIQREDILHRVQTKLGLRIKEHENTLDRYFKAKDKDGFLKFANSFSKKHIPDLLREAVDRYVPQKPGPKTLAPQAGQPLKPPINANGKPAEGFTFVDKMPTRDQIDWSNPFNTLANTKLGRAITIDGKKVSWRKQ